MSGAAIPTFGWHLIRILLFMLPRLESQMEDVHGRAFRGSCRPSTFTHTSPVFHQIGKP